MDRDLPRTIEYGTPSPRRSYRAVVLVALLTAALLFLAGALIFVARVQVVVNTPAVIAPTPAPARIFPPTVPSKMTIPQRTSHALPGSNGSILARIGDITHGQTLLTMSDAAGTTLLDTVAVRRGDVQTFTVGSTSFEIEVLELRNFMTSQDYAVFAMRAAGSAPRESPAQPAR